MLFTQKWIENTIRKVLNIQDEIITDKDIARIKYLHVGETFDNSFFVQISVENPPLPFANTDGGDEWGFCCVRDNNLENFIDKTITNKKDDIDIQLSLGGHNYEDKEMYQYAYSDKAEMLWNTFREGVTSDVYYQEFQDDEAYETWYKQTQINIAIDIANFKGVQVLRVHGLLFDGFRVFKELPDLQVLELVETIFNSIEEIESLKKLQQLCCWCD